MNNPVSQAIRYLVEQVPGVGRTQIVKFLYLADLEARRALGRPLSDLDYIFYNHGPFDSRILSWLDRMEAGGEITTEQVCRFGAVAYCYRTTDKPVPKAFSTGELLILNQVVEMIKNKSLQQVLEDIVYQTKPMRDAIDREAFGHRLRMDLVDNEARIPGLEIEKVLKSIQELDEGKSRPMEEIMAELGD